MRTHRLMNETRNMPGASEPAAAATPYVTQRTRMVAKIFILMPREQLRLSEAGGLLEVLRPKGHPAVRTDKNPEKQGSPQAGWNEMARYELSHLD